MERLHKVRTWLVANWPIKLTALVLATVLWAVVAAQETTTQLVPVDLRIELPAGRAFTSELPNVQARYGGTLRELLKLYESPPVLRATIPDTLTGSQYTLELSADDLEAVDASNVKAQEVLPRAITIQLDDVMQREVPVVSRITIVTDSGFGIIDSIRLSPSSLLVRGPEALVSDIASLPTVLMERRGVRAPVRFTAPIDTTGLGAVVRVQPPEVEVSANVGPFGERVLMGVPVTVADSMTWMSEPSAVMVTVRGPSSRVLQLTRDSVRVEARPRDSRPDQQVELRVVSPRGITGRANPESTSVKRRVGG